MKTSFRFMFSMAFVSAVVLAACAASGNTTGAGSGEDIGRLLENKSFEFVPQSVSPTGGRTRQLTGDFFFRVKNDTIQSYLPYYGRSFTAPINPAQGGMDFTTTDFGYQVSKGSKDATLIQIEPRSGTDVRQMTLQIFPNGSASLQALSNSRSAISYQGQIRAVRRR